MFNLLTVLQKIDDAIYAVQKVFILAGVAAMLVINGAQVFCRYVLHASLAWSEQVSVLIFFILIMLGANLVVKTDSEAKVDVFKSKQPRVAAFMRVITDALCCVALVVFLASSFRLLKQTGKFPQYLSSIHLNYYYIYIWLPIGFGLTLFDKLVNILKSLCVLGNVDTSAIYPPEPEPEPEFKKEAA